MGTQISVNVTLESVTRHTPGNLCSFTQRLNAASVCSPEASGCSPPSGEAPFVADSGGTASLAASSCASDEELEDEELGDGGRHAARAGVDERLQSEAAHGCALRRCVLRLCRCCSVSSAAPCPSLRLCCRATTPAARPAALEPHLQARRYHTRPAGTADRCTQRTWRGQASRRAARRHVRRTRPIPCQFQQGLYRL